jgi:hypothetical protein
MCEPNIVSAKSRVLVNFPDICVGVVVELEADDHRVLAMEL